MNIIPKFVGNGRKALVKGIVEQFDNLTNPFGESRSCWVSLEAPSGWGKTRIGQEVYNCLAARQDKQYWPETILGSYDIELHDVAARRKRIFPNIDEFEREAGSLPNFFWWGLACDMRSSSDVANNLKQDLDQIHRHAPYLEAAWSAQQALGLERYTTIHSAKKAFSAILDEGATTVAMKTAELLGATVPGLGIGVQLARFGLGITKEKIERTAFVRESGSLKGRVDKLDYIQDTALLLSRLATPGLPVLIFVEDLHKASDGLLQLLISLLGYNAPIMIISTTWPGEFDNQCQLKRLLENNFINDRVLRVEYDKAAPKTFPKEASLGELQKDSLSELVYSHYPEAEPETVSRLVDRYPNPLPLELVLTLRRQRKQHPKLMLNVEQVARLPRDVKKLYNELWDELPEPVQNVLSLVTLAMPQSEPVWLNPLVADAIRQLDALEKTEDLLRVLGQDSVSHGWSRTVSTWLRRFGEPDQFMIAKEALTDLYDEDDIEDFRSSLVAKLNEIEFEKEIEKDPHTLHKAWIIISMKDRPNIKYESILNATIYILNSMDNGLLHNRRGYDLCASVLLCRPNSTVSVENLILIIESFKIRFLNQLGMHSDAINESKALAEKLTLLKGKDHLDTLKARKNVASYMNNKGEYIQALLLLNEILVEEMRIFGGDNQSTLLTRNNILSSLEALGENLDAIEEYKALVKLHEKILGPDNLQTLWTRYNFAHSLFTAYKIDEALQEFENLQADQIRILGANHPEIFMTKLNILTCLSWSRDSDEIFVEKEKLLINAINSLGPEHPKVLDIRRSMASTLSDTGKPEKAIEQLHALLEVELRILGSVHENVIATRKLLAQELYNSHNTEGALVVYENLLQAQLQKYSHDHSDVLKTRFDVLQCEYHLTYNDGSRYEREVTLNKFEKLLIDCEKDLGSLNPGVIEYRRTIARYLKENGEIEKALKHYKLLVKHEQERRGPNDPLMFVWICDAADLLLEMGNVKEALEHYKQMLKIESQYDNFEDIHPFLQYTGGATYWRLANCYSLIGPVDQAMKYSELCDQNGGIETRFNIAILLKSDGRIQEAVSFAQNALDDQAALYMEPHKRTGEMQKNIEEWKSIT